MSRARPRRERSAPRWVLPPVPELGVLAAFALLLLFASPDVIGLWAFNGFRSVAPEARLLLVLLAGGAALLPLAPVRSRTLRFLVVAGAALLLAFPLRERIHFLGDSQMRLRSIAAFSANLLGDSLREWTRGLDANPLDIAVNFLVPIGLNRLGLSVLDAVGWVSAAVALAFAAGLWRLGARLAPPAELRFWLCAAVALSGAIEAFAGYAESSALLLAAAVWWWAEMLAPLGSRAQAVRTAAAWLVLFLVHRIGLVMLVPQLARALGPPLEGDRPRFRRLLLALSLAGAALAAGVLLAGTGIAQLEADWRNLLGGPAARPFLRLLTPLDAASHLLLLAPLALLAASLASGAVLRARVGRPEFKLLAAGALPLLPLAWLLPVGENGLGAQRDFDLNLLLGLTLSVAGGFLLAGLTGPRLRGALACSLPVLMLLAGSWIAVNADEPASMRRAIGLASDPRMLAEPHRGALYVFLGQRAMDLGTPQLAGDYYDRAFEIGGNPRRELLAAEAWVVAGDTAAARRSLARARSRGPLAADLERSAALIEGLMPGYPTTTGPPPAAPADSARRGPGPP